ncbi:MAG TPA: hypothetical protein VLF62_04130 [Candidatus Saccharimonadales bacterium]|nr:hypothetical protein [Candidatus Saccharimonadales bacterium]
MRARYIKIIVWVIALVTVWNLGQTYTVTNSLFVFAAAGVIPGTNIALNPNQVLVCLASLLAASVLLIFGTNIYRALRRLVARIKYGAPDALPQTQPRPILAEVALSPVVTAPAFGGKKKKAAKPKKTKTPQPVVIIELPKQPSRAMLLLHVASTLVGMVLRNVANGARQHFPRLAAFLLGIGQAIRRGVSRELQLLGLAAKVCIAGVVRAAHAVTHFVITAIRKTAALVVAAVRWIIVAAAVAAIQATQFTINNSVRFWQWLEPRLRTFDAWLGVHYTRGLQAGRARVTQSGSYRSGMRSWRRLTRLLAGMRDDLRAALIRTNEK